MNGTLLRCSAYYSTVVLPSTAEHSTAALQHCSTTVLQYNSRAQECNNRTMAALCGSRKNGCRCRSAQHGLQCATRSVQQAVCNMQQAACNLPEAACNTQRPTTTCSVRQAACNRQLATGSVQHATSSVQHVTYNVPHAAYNTCSMQSATPTQRHWLHCNTTPGKQESFADQPPMGFADAMLRIAKGNKRRL
jgi:hypothetical protein